MPTTFAVVGGLIEKFSVIMKKQQMLAFITDDVWNSLEIFFVSG